MILWIDNTTQPPQGPYVWRKSLKQAKRTIQTFEQLEYCSQAEFENLVTNLEKSGVNEGNIYFHDETISLIDISRNMSNEYIQLLDWLKNMPRNYSVVTHTSRKKSVASRIFGITR